MKKILVYLIALCPLLAFGQKINFNTIKSPILFKGDSVTAYRDPMAIRYKGVFYLYFTLSEIQQFAKF